MKAHGARVNGLIDFTSGWLVANIGHDNRAVMRAVRKARGWAVMQNVDNPMRQRAIETLRSILPPYLDWFALYSTGSEAIDVAIRAAINCLNAGISFKSLPVVTHRLANHGTTIGAERLACGRYLSYLNQMDSPESVAVLLETFLGPWCKWHSAKLIEKIAERQNAGSCVVMFDEMQAGFGRTGRWFGFEHYDIKPDLVIGGKAAAGGFPFAFIAANKKMSKNLLTRESTFSGNALSCAAFVETVRQIRKKHLIGRVIENEHLITDAFPEAEGKGYAYAFPCEQAKEVVRIAREKGLLLLDTGRSTVKICPPLCISQRDLKRGLGIIKESCEEVGE